MRNKIAIAAAVMTMAAASSAQMRRATVDDMYKTYTVYPESPSALQSTSDGTSYTIIGEDGRTIEQYSYATNKKEGTVMDLGEIRGGSPIESISGYEVSPTGEYVLVYTNAHKIYRRSYEADYYIYDVSHKELKKLSENGGEQEATFSPNGAMVSYIKNNNIRIYKLKYQSSSNVTTDGARNKIINGIPDWVYEEEFSTARSYEWSVDSKMLAYIKYDESEVKEYSFPLYKASYPTKKENALYPGEYTYKYPKAGEANSKVSVEIYDVENRTTKEVDLGKGDIYVPRITWTGAENELAVVRLNRLQNKMEILKVNAKSTVATNIYTDQEECYIDEPAYLQLRFIHGGTEFIVMNEQDGWTHLYLYDTFGNMKKKLTEGEWDVTKLYGIDEATNTVYYQAARSHATKREIYAVNLKTNKTVTIAEGGTNDGDFSEGCKFFVKSHESTTEIPVYSICDAKGKHLKTIEDNQGLKDRIGQMATSKKEMFSFKTVDGTTLNGWVMMPIDYDKSKKYPVVMVQYSGPNSQEVTDTWEYGWEQVLAADGFAVACVDPRGTGARGEQFKKCTYRQLGKIESDDQIEAAKYIGQMANIDKDRIAIWGWSFGGFISTTCMCKSDVFKVGIAVAPVINWRYYDTIYTERFLRKPEQNSEGYDDNSPLNMAANMHGKYLMIHGTADDNVHCQNQMEMIDALVQNGKQFDMFTYPNRNHSIYGGRTRHHLYTMMTEYLIKNL